MPSLLLAPLRDRPFRRFLIFSTYWQASVMVGAPFVIPYFLQHLKMSYYQIAIWQAISSLFTLVTGPLWGRLADRAGHKTVLGITTLMCGSLYPLTWILATPGHMFWIWVSGIVSAATWGGISTAMFNLSIANAPRDQRMAYIAVQSSVNGLSGFAAGMLSGPLLRALLPYELTVLGFHWTGYHSLFVVTAAARCLACLPLRLVDEPRAWSTRQLLRAVGTRGWRYVTRALQREVD